MFLKIKQKDCVSAEYWPITSVVTIQTIKDVEFETSDIVAKVRFKDQEVTINKYQDAWLVNDDGYVLEVINRDYMWGE